MLAGLDLKNLLNLQLCAVVYHQSNSDESINETKILKYENHERKFELVDPGTTWVNLAICLLGF